MKCITQATKKNTKILKNEVVLQGVTIPKGYETNGADIPRIFWFFYPPFSPMWEDAVILHDFLIAKALSTPNKINRTKHIVNANLLFKKELLNIDNSYKNKIAIWCVEQYWKFRIKTDLI